MASFINYRNQGATRNQPLDEDLIKRLQYLEDMGVQMEVFSGGQPGKDEGGARVGSTRHDHGNAADVFFYKDGRKLDWNNADDLPIFSDIVSRGKAAGVTGFGAGPGYMQQGSMHIGMGNPGVWGAGGKGDNAPDWLKSAYNGAKFDPVAEVVAAAPARSPSSDTPLMAAVQAAVPEVNPEEPKKPESLNGPLVQAYNKITGSDAQVPKTILGADTSKVMKGVGGIGDFAKTLMEADESLNKQIAAARPASRSNTPVEIAFTPTEVLTQNKRKKRGSLGGLGGYFI